MEHGRRYHAYKDGAYWGPNDEEAQETNDLAHHVNLLMMNQRLYLAPLNKPQVGFSASLFYISISIMSSSFPFEIARGYSLTFPTHNRKSSTLAPEPVSGQ